MAASSISFVDVDRAKTLWEEYCREHDVRPQKGQTVGIEPVSGRVWFGESATDVHRKLVAEGVDRPAYFVRVGYDYYVLKGSRQRSLVGSEWLSELRLALDFVKR